MNYFSKRCAQLAAGAATVYLCHSLYQEKMKYFSHDEASETESSKLLQYVELAKEIVGDGLRKAKSLLKNEDKYLMECLNKYMEDIYQKPIVQARFPARPEIVIPSEIKFVRQLSGKPVCLGKGSMGVVYLAYHKPTGKKVAIKFATDPRCDINFVIHEAALMTHLNDTKATPYCYGLMPITSDTPALPMAALVMELVGCDAVSKALDVRSFTKENTGKLTHEQFRSFFTDFTEKIDRIHKKGIVINDIKEENILVYKIGAQIETRIIDFGSSRFGDYTFKLDKRLTRSAYRREYSHMAPEIFEDREVTPVSDVYSLSSIFCEAGHFLKYSDLIFVSIKCSRHEPEARPSTHKLLSLLADMDMESNDF